MTTKKKATPKQKPAAKGLPVVATLDELPENGMFKVSFVLNFGELPPFDMMIMSEECGCEFQQIGAAIDDSESGIMGAVGIDVAKLMFSFVRIALRRIDISLDVSEFHSRAVLEFADPT